MANHQERQELFSTFEQDAFHLEMRDEYHVEDELEPLHLWSKGEWTEQAAAEWWEPWLVKIRAATGAGKTVRRIRIVTEPITDYTRFLWQGTRFNISAGEEVRWLPRHRVPSGVILPPEDLWLLDGSRLIFNHFDESTLSMNMERVTDPNMIARTVRVRDQLWPSAIPHSAYRPL
jgi:uncharacterized protein DUF6879